MSAAGPLLSEVQVGDSIPELRRTVSQEQISAYAEAAGDPNPIHQDEELARSFGFEGTIAHGMLSLAILTEAVSAWAGGYERVTSIEVRFSRPLYRGDSITCSGRVTAVDQATGLVSLELEATSGRGERVLTNGRATARLSTTS